MNNDVFVECVRSATRNISYHLHTESLRQCDHMGYFVYASLFQLLFNIAFTYTTSLLLITGLTPINKEGNLNCNIWVQKTNQTITARCIKSAPIVRDVFTSLNIIQALSSLI